MDENTKKEITELEAVAEVINLTLKAADSQWPDLIKSLCEMYPEKFILEDEKMAPFDFGMAVLALGLESTKNLFTKQQSERLIKYALFAITNDELGDYAKKEVESYFKEFEQDYKVTHNYPHDNVASRLLHRLLGKNISNLAVKFGEKQTNILDPIIIELLSSAMVTLMIPNPWKIIHDQYELKESDISLEELKKETEKIKNSIN